MEGFIQVTTTTATREDAERIAHSLVETRLAACVQIVGPIETEYGYHIIKRMPLDLEEFNKNRESLLEQYYNNDYSDYVYEQIDAMEVEQTDVYKQMDMTNLNTYLP